MEAQPELLIRTADGATRSVPIPAGPFRIGRAADNDLSFPGEQELSRHHLEFHRESGGWFVRDLGSRNGTFLNGAAVRGAAPLRSGDRISAGKLILEFRVGATSSREESHAPEFATVAVKLDHLLTATGPDAGEPAVNPLASARHLRALLQAGIELSGRLPLDQLLPLILTLAADAVDAPRGMLLLEENGSLAARATRGRPFPLSSAVRDRVMSGRESLLIQDMEREEHMRLQASIVAQCIRSLMAVPLQTSEKVIGLLYLDSAGAARAFTREDLNFITVLANMAAAAIENARLAEVEERERRVSLEMEQAAAIQRALLPAQPPAMAGLDIAALNQSCHQAGGDYYDFFQRPDGRLAILVGDIAGKGMPAALLMASLQARVQVLIESEPALAPLVSKLNRITATHCPGNRFVTLFCCLLDPASGELEFVNAGHNPPLVIRRSGAVDRLDAGGLLLGVFPHSAYQTGRSRLETGDTLVLYSDGVTEAAATGSDEEFGEPGLAGAVQAAAGLPAATIAQRVREAVERHAGGISSADDFTLVVVRKTAA